VTIGEMQGYTPMHGAGFQGRDEIATLLILHGLDPSDRHADGFTPLHRACWGREERHTETVRALLRAGVRPNEAAADGSFPCEHTSNFSTAQVIEGALQEQREGEKSDL